MPLCNARSSDELSCLCIKAHMPACIESLNDAVTQQKLVQVLGIELSLCMLLFPEKTVVQRCPRIKYCEIGSPSACSLRRDMSWV